MPAVEPVIVELGIGTYPNAPFYARAAPQRIDVVGVDPNEAMEPYAKSAAASAGLDERGHSLRVVSGPPTSSHHMNMHMHEHEHAYA